MKELQLYGRSRRRHSDFALVPEPWLGCKPGQVEVLQYSPKAVDVYVKKKCP